MVRFQFRVVLLATTATSWFSQLGTCASSGYDSTGYSSSASYAGFNQYQHPPQSQIQPQTQQYSQRETPSLSYQEGNPPGLEATESPVSKAEVSPSSASLPEGWVEYCDPNSGEFYYYNEADGTTTWDRPVPQIVEEEEKSSIESYDISQDSHSQSASDTPEDPSGMQHNASVSSTSDSRIENDEYGGFKPGTGTEESQADGLSGDITIEQSGDIGDQQKHQQNQHRWGQHDSTLPPPESEDPKYDPQTPQYHTTPSHPSGWGMPQNPAASSEWGIPKSMELQTPRPKYQQDQQQSPNSSQQPPSYENQQNQQNLPPSQSFQRPPIGGRWGVPPISPDMQPKPDQPWQQSHEPPQRKQEQQERQQSQTFSESEMGHRPMNSLRPGGQQMPPIEKRPQQQLQQQLQQQPSNVPRRYPQFPYGEYSLNAPPGYGQYSQPYGSPGPYYGGHPRQQQQPQRATGQLVPQGFEEGASVMKEALSSTWRGILGFSNRTLEAVETAREQVVTSATAAGQTIGSQSMSFWERAKSTLGSVFENNDSASQQPYSLSGRPQPQPGNQSPREYPVGPHQPGRRPPPGYPGGPPQLNRIGPQSGYPQQGGQYGTGPQQPPRYGGGPPGYGGGPPGQRQPPPVQQEQDRQPPQGYPPMQPRRDIPYPSTDQGLQRGPMQSEYRGIPQVKQNPGGHPPRAQSQRAANGYGRPPYRGSHVLPPTRQQPPPPPEQQRQSLTNNDPWDHPGLMENH